MKNAFCLLTIRPNKIWVDFLQTFTADYDVYIMIDDNSYDCTGNVKNYPNINFIQIANHICKNAGYIYSNTAVMKTKDIIAWDKALYYFTLNNRNYEQIWLCEDDVYIYSKDLISQLDDRYKSSDLICEYLGINRTGNLNSWRPSRQALGYFKLPWCNSMVCCSRVSLKLLDNIHKYVSEFGKLNFIELIIPTIAYQHNLIISNPSELSTVQYRTAWNKDDIDKTKIYHPFKNMEDHQYMRNR